MVLFETIKNMVFYMYIRNRSFFHFAFSRIVDSSVFTVENQTGLSIRHALSLQSRRYFNKAGAVFVMSTPMRLRDLPLRSNFVGFQKIHNNIKQQSILY